MLPMSAKQSLSYSNSSDVGVWLISLVTTITSSVGVPGRTIVVTESHVVDSEYAALRIYTRLLGEE